ncbi:MAG: hypothetical protein ACRDSR_06905 [Pseudonocardiaceae bacterium]
MLAEAGFPPAQRFGSDPDDIDAQGLGSAPDSWEQLQLDIPGLKPIIKLRGRMGAVVRDEGGAKVADVAAYLDMCQQMHDNFGKTVDQIRDSLTPCARAAVVTTQPTPSRHGKQDSKPTSTTTQRRPTRRDGGRRGLIASEPDAIRILVGPPREWPTLRTDDTTASALPHRDHPVYSQRRWRFRALKVRSAAADFGTYRVPGQDPNSRPAGRASELLTETSVLPMRALSWGNARFGTPSAD